MKLASYNITFVRKCQTEPNYKEWFLEECLDAESEALSLVPTLTVASTPVSRLKLAR